MTGHACSSNHWLGNKNPDPMVCLGMIRERPTECNQYYFNHAGGGDGNCGCVTDLNSDCSSYQGHGVVNIMHYVGPEHPPLPPMPLKPPPSPPLPPFSPPPPTEFILADASRSCDDTCATFGGRCDSSAMEASMNTEAGIVETYASIGGVCKYTSYRCDMGGALPGVSSVGNCRWCDRSGSYACRARYNGERRLCGCVDVTFPPPPSPSPPPPPSPEPWAPPPPPPPLLCTMHTAPCGDSATPFGRPVVGYNYTMPAVFTPVELEHPSNR